MVEEAFRAKFSASNDGAYTTLSTSERYEELGPHYVQVKASPLKSETSALNESDRLNNITWAASYTIPFSAYRTAFSKDTPLTWSLWSSAGESELYFRAVEVNGQLSIQSMHMQIFEDSFGFANARKVDTLPQSLR